MQTLKRIKTTTGRVTIQRNSYGIPEIKVRSNGVTYKASCHHYANIENLEQIVETLLSAEKVCDL